MKNVFVIAFLLVAIAVTQITASQEVPSCDLACSGFGGRINDCCKKFGYGWGDCKIVPMGSGWMGKAVCGF